MPIAVVGMLDEREPALRLIRDCIEQRGHRALLLDISVGNGAIIPSLEADVNCRELAALGEAGAGGGPDRARTAVMAEGLRAKIASLHAAGAIDGILAITGMTGALIVLRAMEALPFGLPKLLISGATAQPMHAARFADYFSLRDVTVMHTVVDTVGMNALVRTLAVNGANAICGMVEGKGNPLEVKKPSVAITEFGFCDRGAHRIREILEGEYDLVSFHATGLGDKALMELLPHGIFGALIDLVPGAFSEYLLGGNRGFAGEGRLRIAESLPIPYIFCPGGFDIISCGPIERKNGNDPLWTSRKLAERKLYLQDAHRVQARMNPEETKLVAAAAARELNRYPDKARVKAVIPLKGFSSIGVRGGPLHDPAADAAFRFTFRRHLDPGIEIVEVDSDINSPEFAHAVAAALSRAGMQGGAARHA